MIAWRRYRGMLVAFGLAAGLAGCSGGPRPNLQGLAVDAAHLQGEAKTYAADSTSLSYYEASIALQGLSDSYVAEDKSVPAALALEESAAAARASLAASAEYRRRVETDRCRRRAADMRREWEDSIRILEQTEKVAGRQARGVERNADLTWNQTPYPQSPTPPLDTLPQASDIRSQSRDWKRRAAELNVPVSDLDARIIASLTAYQAKDAKPENMENHVRLAGWALVEMAHRVRAEGENRNCAEALERALEFGGYRDQALWAMVELERGAKEGVRKQLEEERSRLANREQELFESLQQFEGKFASIRREARGTIMSLSDILFDFGKSELRREAEINLAKMAVILSQYPEMKIQVEGHTDNIGSEEFNLKLSERRAQTVNDFLVSQGISPERMSTLGYGMSQPVESNATDEGRQKNRRVDLVIREE